MKKLSKKEFMEIDKWMHLNSRELELTMWNYHFMKGNRRAVLSALTHYQNDDGGFGNMLEPDSWNPNSSPYTTLNAINILKEIVFFDMNHPIYEGIIRFLDSGIHSSQLGWFFSIPFSGDYPHAPWWTYDEAANSYENIGVTAEIAAFVIGHLEKNTRLYAKALKYAYMILKKIFTLSDHGEMGIAGYCILIDTMQEAGYLEPSDFDKLSKKISSFVSTSIELDISKWDTHVIRPSRYIKSPQSDHYKNNKDIMQIELDYLLDAREHKGVWAIDWSWFDLNEKYPKEFAISENWWKGIGAIQNIMLLKNFDRVDKI